MTLPAQREAFAQAVCSGLNGSDAYRATFKVRPKTSAKTVHEAASRLMNDRKVSARIAELKAVLASKALWTREKSVTALANIADDHKTRPSDKTAAIKELNAMHGYNAPTVLAVDIRSMPDAQLDAKLAAALHAKS